MDTNPAAREMRPIDNSEAQGRVGAVVLLFAATIVFVVEVLAVAGANGGLDIGALGLALLCGALLLERLTARSR